MSETHPLEKLARQVEKETLPDRDLECRAWNLVGWTEGGDFDQAWMHQLPLAPDEIVNGMTMAEALKRFPKDTEGIGRCWNVPRLLRSVDAAFTLLPSSAVNVDLWSHTVDGGKPAWTCRFTDTAQLVGEVAAREKLLRIRKSTPVGSVLRGPPSLVLEKAIAEQYREFHATARTAARALTSASLRSRLIPEPGEETQ